MIRENDTWPPVVFWNKTKEILSAYNEYEFQGESIFFSYSRVFQKDKACIPYRILTKMEII